MDTPNKSTIAGKAGESTRAMQATRYVAALSIFLVMVILIILYVFNRQAIVTLGLPGALIIGAAYIAVLKILEKKSNEYLNLGDRADRGAKAEEDVGEFLKNFSEDYFLIHDFDSGRGNIDHILIGPKGIFTLETKSHRGSVEFDGKSLLLNGRPFEKDFLKQAWAQCFLAREILSGWEITDPKPEPTIIFTNAYVKVRGKAKGVEVVTLSYFKNLLSRRPDRLSVPEAGRIFNRLKAASKKST